MKARLTMDKDARNLVLAAAAIFLVVLVAMTT
jgi:hypothetical protein